MMANEAMVKKTVTNGSVALFGDDLDKGFENMTQQDLALPFIRILGQLSPQVTEGDAKYVSGAKHGMIYNTVTSERYDGKQCARCHRCPATFCLRSCRWPSQRRFAPAPWWPG